LSKRPRRSNLRRYLFEPDDTGKRAHFALLILAQLKQQRHRGRFQLLDFRGVGIDRCAGRVRIGLATGVNLSRYSAQRAFHRRPIGFLIQRKLEALLDAGDLHIAEQRVGFLQRRLAGFSGKSGIAAAGTAIFGAWRSAGVVAAKACRSGSLRVVAVDGGSKDARASVVTASRSVLLSRFATGLLTTGDTISERAIGTLSLPRMLAKATPATRKHVSAMMVIALVKPYSVSADEPRRLSSKLDTN
jgi:hypothetical protein